jgi:Holliday junction resolvase RusA-like endonuclease
MKMKFDKDILSNGEIIYMIEDMASEGHAPDDGCTLFGVGNDEYINILKDTYFNHRFKRGGSSEKFIVGHFGSGKTHFVNQLSEVARQMDCVTSTVALNKNVDVTSNYAIYTEIVREIRPPESKNKGLRELFNFSYNKIMNNCIEQTTTKEDADNLLKLSIDSLEKVNDFEFDIFGRVAKQLFDSILKNDAGKQDLAIRWIGGEFQNKEISKALNIQTFSKSELNLIASKVNLCLYQLIKKVGFLGTVVVFDEAEQGFEIGKKKQSILYSIMQSDINSIVNLKGGSVLILYAIVPDIREGMMNFPALQQRVQHPFPFGKDNPRAPLIEIHRSGDSQEDIKADLVSIGNKLSDLLYTAAGSKIKIDKKEVKKSVELLADRVMNEEISISNRRMMVKGVCSLLLHLYENGKLLDVNNVNIALPLESDLDDEV